MKQCSWIMVVATAITISASWLSDAQALENAVERPAKGWPTESHDVTFVSGGKTIKAERFTPVDGFSGKRPAVIVLHGSDGFVLGGLWYRYAAKNVAAAGYETYLVHYFNRTGDWRVSDHEEIHAKVPVWTETVREAVNFVAAQPTVDAERIGLVGISLGGGLGIATAAQDKRIKVLVDYFGFVPKTFDEATMTLPPTLILHGDADTVVEPSNARRLDAFLTKKGIAHEIKIYAGKGHAFRGKAGTDADARAEAWLAKYLH